MKRGKKRRGTHILLEPDRYVDPPVLQVQIVTEIGGLRIYPADWEQQSVRIVYVVAHNSAFVRPVGLKGQIPVRILSGAPYDQ